MSVLTIYNHGSGGWSGKKAAKDEIVNLFGNAHARQCGNTVESGASTESYELSDKTPVPYVITEGVGGKGDPHQHETTFVPGGGAGDGAGRLVERHGAKEGQTSRTGGRTKANITGAGVQQNVHNVLEILKYLKKENRAPRAINMIGWSRGAVTCIRQASEIWRDGSLGLSGVPINIFAVDPVAGGSADAEQQGGILYPNVKNFVAVLALDENRKTFQPKTQSSLRIASPGETKSAFVHLPGVHADVAKWASPPGYVTFDLAARFLCHHGTIISGQRKYMLSKDDLLRCYFNMVLGTRIVSQGGKGKWKNGQSGLMQRAIGMGFGKRKLRVEQLSADEERLFVNFHHEQLFKKYFTRLYEVCFNSNLQPLQWKMAIARQEAALTILDQYSPGIAELLARTNRSLTRTDESAWAQTLVDCNMIA